MNKEIKELIEVSRFYGQKKEYVIAGGGNTSFKNEDYLWIKASGINLGDIDENGFCVLDRKKLNDIPNQQFSNDSAIREEEVKNALLNSRINSESGLRPSVETSLHNLFSYQFVVHTHSTLVNGLMCSNQAAEKTKEFFGEDVLFVPYSDPGFVLFKIIAEKIDEYNTKFKCDPKIVFIQNHGIFVAADSTKEIDQIYADVKNKLENSFDVLLTFKEIPVSEIITEVLPAVRMLLSDEKLKVATALNSSWVANFISDKEAFEAGIAKPFNPDQMVYCMSEYLFIENNTSTKKIIEEAKVKIAEFKNRKGAVPKVIFFQNKGVIVAEDSPVSVAYLKDMVNDFCEISTLSENFGGVHPLTKEQATFIENWEVEHYRKKVSLGGKPSGRLENKIVIVTGAAQGFGAGIAEILHNEGANIIVADLNEEKGKEFANLLNSKKTKNKAYFISVNVAESESVKKLVDETVLQFGGLDVMISNAGILRAGSLDEMDQETFELMTRVNYTGYFLCAKHSKPVMKLQNSINPDHFTDIIQINSKSGLKGSNKNFAYSGGKFGGIGLTQSFALELMPFKIKVNSICPGNFFDGPLWSDPKNGLFVQYLNTGKVPGAKTINDVKAFYEAQVPAGRGCTAEDVAKAIFYVIDQQYETGQAVPVTGGQNMLK
ncbi:MAG: SDR family NAD(P)-dependent oxidoreductase [Prolixibacteraceae bacterium]|jgi:NAD(P)-dependent dehydrogenase (short-subunit alcohol dehydrogenase family)/rhamnose utilization protein RhaD (predicted bifunctional aldolase and dehydrogenase)|nr:SDR family NAD(P)-dependent oxidoreductase [Prolixibacteraceae bacterium]MBT6005161.1 SDR family NAD(P)-dependent oxidoreductase [Prolixibacteraceae bacterium]MBT6766479.1 SDR family NAD(P)-dependent oxidoreductase [Prolixibacteraceae bacterium]MBT6997735.1 SDR family NAD(P)-dependent oxidoreductase [Prolixibacteraceae bacterium]MBT7396493.1 SDR family NAD(P)-dependent oxidoreductase [Prolixibacteraceae bacterium]